MVQKVVPDNIPQVLRERSQWVVWRLEKREGKSTKVPYIAGGVGKASSTDSTTWRPFEDALQAYEESELYHGLGFVFSSGDPFTGIDLDDCRNPETGELQEWAQEWVDRFGSYAEASPSGTGAHIIVKGKTPHNGKRTVDEKTVEIYSIERFFTVTGMML